MAVPHSLNRNALNISQKNTLGSHNSNNFSHIENTQAYNFTAVVFSIQLRVPEGGGLGIVSRNFFSIGNQYLYI